MQSAAVPCPRLARTIPDRYPAGTRRDCGRWNRILQPQTDKGLPVSVLSLFRSARPARHRYIARYLTSQHDHPRFLITGGRCHGRLSFNCSTVRFLAGARCLWRKVRQAISSWSMTLSTHRALDRPRRCPANLKLAGKWQSGPSTPSDVGSEEVRKESHHSFRLKPISERLYVYTSNFVAQHINFPSR